MLEQVCGTLFARGVLMQHVDAAFRAPGSGDVCCTDNAAVKRCTGACNHVGIMVVVSLQTFESNPIYGCSINLNH